MSPTSPSDKPKDWFQILAICTACLTSFACGLFFSWSSPAIPNLQLPPYNFTLEQCSYIPVISSLTMSVASFYPGVFIDNLGRKRTILFTTSFYVVSGILNLIADNIYVFYLGRFFAGVGDAFFFATVPVYIGEISTPKVRGRWGNLLSVNIFLGQFVVNVIGGYLDLRTTAWICLVPLVVFFCVFPFMPESPYYLVMKGELEGARKALRTLRRINHVDDEVKQLESAVKRQLSESSNWKDLFVMSNHRKPTVAVIFMRIAQQTAGYATFSAYGKYIFQRAAGSISATDSAIIFTGCVCVLSFFGSFTMDKFGRKLSMVFTLLSAGCILSGLTVFFYLDQFTELRLDDVKFVPLVGMLLYVVAWCFGFGIVPNLMMGELFSAAVKAKGMTIANVTFGLGICSMSKLFQVLDGQFGLYFPFGVFAVCTLVNGVLAYFLVPETRGKTLEEIQLEFKTGSKNGLRV